MNYAGKRLGNYRLIRPIGQGGYGQVYLGYHFFLEVTVAIKSLHPAMIASQHVQNLFLEEARLIARLEHPAIIRVRDFDESAAAYLSSSGRGKAAFLFLVVGCSIWYTMLQ